ncbi:hypothetical protein MMC17_000007 [Xylographa soralifera]|nr:hypothetical protein [Xylographa soralifera]
MSDPPLINPMVLIRAADLELLMAAVKCMRAAFASSALAPILISSEVLSGESVRTDEEIMTSLRRTTYPTSHGFTTCKMGKSSEAMAVVDTHGSAYDAKNLRVVDGSSFPFLPVANLYFSKYRMAFTEIPLTCGPVTSNDRLDIMGTGGVESTD